MGTAEFSGSCSLRLGIVLCRKEKKPDFPPRFPRFVAYSHRKTFQEKSNESKNVFGGTMKEEREEEGNPQNGKRELYMSN